MIRPAHLLAAGAMALSLSVLTGGATSPGRVLVELGLPGIATGILAEPGALGSAQFHAQRYAQAADTFAASGHAYNEGLAAANSGDYARALAAWDQVLAADPGDQETLENHAIVSGLLAGTEFDPVAAPEQKDGDATEANPGQGKARAASTGDEAENATAGFWMPEITSEGIRRVSKIFDEQYVGATDRWLTTLEDQPGVYLRARLAAEQKRRIANGTALPPAEDPR